MAADAAIQAAISNFTAAHAVDPPLVQFFDLAGLQRSFKKEALGLGFIDTVNGWCALHWHAVIKPLFCVMILSDRHSSLELSSENTWHSHWQGTHAQIVCCELNAL